MRGVWEGAQKKILLGRLYISSMIDELATNVDSTFQESLSRLAMIIDSTIPEKSNQH